MFKTMAREDASASGIAAVDMYKMDAEGKAIEHWDRPAIRGRCEECRAPPRSQYSAREPERDVLALAHQAVAIWTMT